MPYRCFRAGPLLLALTLLVVTAGASRTLGQSNEDYARRQYESGLAFLRDLKYAEALKDFQAVVDQYGSSHVADLALFQIAQYHLEVAKAPDAALEAVTAILKKYPTGEAAPLAHVLAGRIELARGRAASLETALASFERARRLFPGSEAVPASLYHAAEALRGVKRDDDALALYREVSTDHGQSAWAARALLGEGRCLLGAGRSVEAMQQWQRVRLRYPRTPEAGVALAWNTIAYRLYVRAPAQPPYDFSGTTLPKAPGKIKDVVGLASGPQSELFVATKSGLQLFDADGRPGSGQAANAGRGVAIGAGDRPYVFQRNAILLPEGGSLSLSVPKPDGTLRPLDDIPAAVVTSFGEWLVVDKDARVVARFAADGKYLAPYASAEVSRLAINGLDDVAAIARNDRSLLLFDRDGRQVKRLPASGQGYQMDNPVDITFDALGHLYALDRGRAQVIVFGPQLSRVALFTLPDRAAGAFRKAVALSVDAAGRLYIYDDDVERVLVYQ